MAITETLNVTSSTTSLTTSVGATDRELVKLYHVVASPASITLINSALYTITGYSDTSTALSIVFDDWTDYVGDSILVVIYTDIDTGNVADAMLTNFGTAANISPTTLQNEMAHVYYIIGQITGGAAVGTVDLSTVSDNLTNIDALADIVFASPTQSGGHWDGSDTLSIGGDTTVEGILTTHESRLDTAETDIDTAQTDIDSLETSVAALLTAAGFPNPYTVAAADVNITDTAGYYTGTNVETALAEVHLESIYRAQRQWLYSAIGRFNDRGAALTDANNAIAINGNEVMIGTDNSGGTGADNGVLYSSNRGGSYTARTSTISSLTSVNAVACNADGSLWVAVGVPATNDGMAWSNDNGATWTNSNDNSGQTLRGVAFDGTRFVAVGDAGTILTTTDGTAPTARTADGTPANISFFSVKWLPSFNLFVACGLDTTTSNHGEIQTSPNGTTWTARTSAVFAGTFREAAEFSIRGTPYAMVVGGSGEIQYSANATSGWTNIPSASSTTFNSCVGVPGGAVIVGDSGIVHIVTNLSFSKGLYQILTGVTSDLYIVEYSANTGILVGGAGGKLYQTVDYDLES